MKIAWRIFRSWKGVNFNLEYVNNRILYQLVILLYTHIKFGDARRIDPCAQGPN